MLPASFGTHQLESATPLLLVRLCSALRPRGRGAPVRISRGGLVALRAARNALPRIGIAGDRRTYPFDHRIDPRSAPVEDDLDKQPRRGGIDTPCLAPTSRN